MTARGARRPPRVVFLPGASGDPDFWTPVARRLPASWEKVLLGWPGLGSQPHDPAVRSLEDLVALTLAAMDGRPGAPAGAGDARDDSHDEPRYDDAPSDLVAQSMGGVVALRVAARHPERVRRVVLVATSGGLDLAVHGAEDWRPSYRTEHPFAAGWITEPVGDERGAIARVRAPVLLLWGDADPISPVSVGEELAATLPDATLSVIPGGDHGVARDAPAPVAALIAAHLGSSTRARAVDTLARRPGARHPGEGPKVTGRRPDLDKPHP